MHRRNGSMRLQFSNVSRPKQAAKNLARLSSSLSLASAQGALAQALGYRDWHEFSNLAGPDTPVSRQGTEVPRIIGAVADATGLNDGDVQYALARARLFGSTPWSLDDQLGLRARLWRERLFGAPARGKPGTVVRDKAYGSNASGYLLKDGRPTTILLDSGLATRADFEVATPRSAFADFIPSRLWLPYGFWTLLDGSEVLFSRDYLPLWRVANGIVDRLDPWLWIEGKAGERFFLTAGSSRWVDGPARERGLEALTAHRIAELPRLVDVMVDLLAWEAESILPAVARMRERYGATEVTSAYARINDNLAYG